MIALWGLPDDRPLAAVLRELTRLSAPVVLLDQTNAPAAGVILELDERLGGHVTAPGLDLDLAEVTALYARPYGVIELCSALGLQMGSTPASRTVEVEALLSAWWAAFPGLSVNPPEAMALNGSKPRQLSVVAEYGFAVPETLVTTDTEEALTFWARHDRVVYKSVSSVRSRVSLLSAEDRARFSDLIWCPTQFQEWVEGEDVRVHVVGDQVFPTAVRSQAIDYRYPGATEPELAPCVLPEDVAARCRAMCTAMNLAVAGVDLRRSPNGSWYCFEVNPSPAFTYYQSATGQPVAAAVARLLAGLDQS